MGIKRLVGLAGIAAWSVPAAAPMVPPVARLIGVPRRLPGARGIALTFDDGPHREGTVAVLEALREGRATATFFLVGEQVEKLPSLAGEITAAGHAVGVHGYRHTLLLRRLPAAVREDLARAADVIGSATGVEPVLYRPPYGVFTPAALRLVRKLGWSPYLWSRWGRDWDRSATRGSIVARATRNLGGGDVVLLHDADHYSSAGSWLRTAAAVPGVLEAASQTGESLVALSQSR
jgi:peptidoglycan/xylan/chitin deacetylase (PgdA/CDA1 family)